MGSLLAIAMPLLMIVTAFRALIAAAGRQRGGVMTPALVLVFLGALSSGMVFWWEDVVLSKPPSSQAWGGGLLPYIAADFLIWVCLWALIARGTVWFVRRRGAGS